MLNLKSKVQYKVNTEQCILHSDKLIIPTIFLHYLTISQILFFKNSQICTNCYKIPSKQKIYINDGYTYICIKLNIPYYIHVHWKIQHFIFQLYTISLRIICIIMFYRKWQGNFTKSLEDTFTVPKVWSLPINSHCILIKMFIIAIQSYCKMLALTLENWSLLWLKRMHVSW